MEQSPFLPGTNIQFAWDSTSLSYFKTCPRLYKYILVDRWGSDEESVHLRFGQEYHSAIQDYVNSCAAGITHEDAVHDTIRALLERTWDSEANAPWKVDEDTKAGKYKNRRSLVRTVIWYLEQFKDDAAQPYIKDDGKPAVELSFRFELDWGPGTGRGLNPSPQPYLLCGHLDLVVSFANNLYVMDHKTTTSTPGPYYFDQYSPHNQMSLYTIAGKILLNSPIKGVIINACQILIDTNRFVRGFTYRTPDQSSEWLNDLKHWLALAELYATQDYWPMNDTACDKFGGCRFREVCSASPSVRDKILKSKFKQLPPGESWNPLRSR